MFALRFRQKLPPAVAAELDKLVAQLRAFLSVSFNEDGTLLTQVTTAIGATSGIPTGAMFPYGGTSAPSGYLLCDGSAVNRNTYADLFTAIGTAYGTGDGSTTFNIPDCRGRFLFGKATSGTGSTVGATFGSIDHTHTGPSHQHAVTGGPTVGTPSATTIVQSGTGSTVASSTHTHALTGSTDASGAGNTGTGNPPGLVANFIIRTGL